VIHVPTPEPNAPTSEPQTAARAVIIPGFMGDVMEDNVSDLQKLIPVYALLSRIRLSSSEHVLQTAEQVIKTIVNTYPQPNLTAEQIQSRAVNGQDPLRQFSDTCRAELDSLQQQL
jgi:hypothetical protein